MGGGQFFFLEALRIGLKKIRKRFQNDPNQNKASRTQKPPNNMVFSGSKKAKNWEKKRGFSLYPKNLFKIMLES